MILYAVGQSMRFIFSDYTAAGEGWDPRGSSGITALQPAAANQSVPGNLTPLANLVVMNDFSWL